MSFASDNWERVKQLFEAALDLESSQWPAFLAKNCDDETMRQQIELLLFDYKEAGSFLDEPALSSKIAAPEVELANTAEAFPEREPGPGDLSATATSAEPDDPMIGRKFGSYRLAKRVGKGGMAVVYLAERADDEYHTQVAIKVVQPGLDSHDLLTRFRNERQTLASLDHPNIVKLLDGGSTPDGVPFLVMDYVKGCPIDDYCDRHRFSVDERLQVFSKVCEAVQYAHQKGVIHRDIKPGNILVTGDGIPKLLDFGIAKVLNAEPLSQKLLATQTGMRCMTPAYASPEQMQDKSITTATDIYSLGVVLYELLSGHYPYRLTQHTPAEIERAICEQDPEAPSTAVSRVETDTSFEAPITKTPEVVSLTREGQPDRLRRRLRGDLDNIVLKALQKEPEKRYGSVEEFSQDIGRHLQHLPVKARPNTLTYRTSKFVRRHKTEVGAAFTVLVVIAFAASFAFNMLGFRDRVVGSVSSSRIQSVNRARPFNPRGWVTASAASAQPAISCGSLIDLKLPDTTFTLAESVLTGSFTPPNADTIQSLPPFCRVEGAIKPTPDSDIRFALWLPISGWNGKFRGVGNGGGGGSINFDDMGPAIRRGYATASTDTGHRGDERDFSWALHHPEKVVDSGYRAIHEMTEKSKQIIRAFYGQSPRWSFFEGCSNGGRQGLMEAQRFPEDYQGILAGASPISTTHSLAAGLYNTGIDPTNYIPPNKIRTISTAVLATCDGLDGVNDGILNDPRQCHFDPAVLVCRGADSDNCLTPEQVVQLKKIYAGLQNSKGEQLFPGYLPGGEDGEEGWKGWITGPAPGQALNFIYGIRVFRNVVFADPTWDFRKVTVGRAIQIADEKTAQIMNTTDPDLRGFKARGNKLILYHGWSDADEPGSSTINYYNAISASMGSHEADGFVRLYMAPGMQHCYGGPGPNFFGQFDLSVFGGNSQQVSIPMDSQHNVSRALEQWVEEGDAPDAIIATKYVNDLDPAQGVKMTRPLCPYPQIAKYKGTGNSNDASNFLCTELNDQH